jgi:geranylgeranyl pyrophosphate synthase
MNFLTEYDVDTSADIKDGSVNLSEKYNLFAPVEYTLESGGKNTRELIIKYIQNLLKNDNNPVTDRIIKDINLLHNSSLVIDDIQDGSLKRRGKECAHIKYGVPISINAGYLQCFSLLNDINQNYPKYIHAQVKDIYHKYFALMHIGQGLDIEWTTRKTIPTLDEYNIMMDNKTGSGFLCPIELCIASTSVDTSTHIKNLSLELGKYIGRFFQIRDDYINLTCPKYWRLKTFCEDFDEKKVSYIFTLLKTIDPKDISYEYLDSKSILSKQDKIMLYKNLYDKKILHKTYMILQQYLAKIKEIERKITLSDGTSSFLAELFKKLEISLPIEPNQIKQVLLMSSMG